MDLLINNQSAIEKTTLSMVTTGSQIVLNSSTINNQPSSISGGLSHQDKLLIVDIRLFVYGWVVLPVAIIGLVLNSFTILVLLHPRMRNFSTNAYLTTLSLANIVCLINFILLYSIRYIVSYEFFKRNAIDSSGTGDIHPYESFINLIYGIWSPIFTTFQLYAIYLTVAVTVDRWIYVTWPLKADTICTMKNTFRAVGIIFLFCFMYNLPRWFEIESYQFKSSTNRTYYQARHTKFGSNYTFNQIMRRYGYMIFVYGLPFTILLVVNIGIVRKMIEAKRRKKVLLGASKFINPSKPLLIQTTHGLAVETISKKNKYQSKSSNTTTTKSKIRSSIASTLKLDPKITFMVMGVVIAFFLCQFPYLIINILATKHANEKWFHIAKAICDLLAALNCCINFLIYCIFGQNFRQIAKLIFCNPSLNPYDRAVSLRSQISEKRKKLKKSYILNSNVVSRECSNVGVKQESV